MRILVLCYEYPPIGGGGGRVAQSVAEALAARGHEVRVQTAALGWRSEQETRNGVEIFRTASGRKAPGHCDVHEMALFLATSLWPTLRHCRTWRPDVLHAHFALPSGVLAWAAQRCTGLPYVLTAHLGDVPGGVPEQTDALFRLAGPLARAVWHRAAAATAVSDFVRELAERAYGRPVRRILNGIDLTDRPARPTQLSSGPCHLVFLGRLNPQKNAPLLIDTLVQIADLPWRLTVIGDGPDSSEVRRRVRGHHLEKRVHLLGWQTAEEVATVLRGADILCLPSSSEGLPMAAVEALKDGLALACSDIPGFRNVVTPGVNGQVAPPGQSEALAAILRTLVSDPERLLAMRQASWDLVGNFALPAIADQYEQVLRSAFSFPEPASQR